MEIAVNAPAGVKSQSRRPRSRKRPIPMVVKLAYRNLFHDRLSFFVTVIGIVFSVVLVAVQSGIYLGSEKKIAAILDAAPADLWIVPLGTKSYDDPAFLSGRERHMALSAPGVANSEDMIVSFASWRKPRRRQDHGAVDRHRGGQLEAASPGTSSRAAARPSRRPIPSASIKVISPTSASASSATMPS